MKEYILGMINKIRYFFAYYFIDWGLKLIPNPELRSLYEFAIRSASDSVVFSAEVEEFRQQQEAKTNAYIQQGEQ